MKTKATNLYNQNSIRIGIYEKPLECPYCGAYCDPTKRQHVIAQLANIDIYLLTFSVECCEKLFFGVYEKASSEQDMELLLVYPPVMPMALPDKIKEVSPRFVKLYGQAAFAEQNNFFELAGTGYRNAVEILIKDFAIQKLNATYEEVSGKSLNQSITTYLPSVEAKVSADILRQLGNSYTHYDNKNGGIEFSVFKQYIEIFIRAIEFELLIADPVLPSKHLPKDQNQS